jgi:tungstate transport system permease protein
MIIAQFVIVTPIIIALSKQTMDIIYAEYKDFIASLRLSAIKAIILMIYDTRHLLIVTGLAGLGRALAEVGAVMIVGGNIAHQTRMMTTSIALETSRGDLSRALALGLILIFLSVFISLIGDKFKNNNLLVK